MRWINPASTVFLVGAGVTASAGGPVANELLTSIAEALICDAEWRKRIFDAPPVGHLRFETAMECLEAVVDPKLDVLNLFDALIPGPLHCAIASAAGAGARVVTVNFDDLLEQALRNDGLSPWTIDLQTGANAERLFSPSSISKIHGTLAIHHGDAGSVGNPTPLHATIPAIVRAGGGLGLAPKVQQYLQDLVAKRTLIVVGYSGSDDLDVMPSLAKCAPESVVWIHHVEREPAPISDSIRALLDVWRQQSVTVDVIDGFSDKALSHLGFKVGARWSEEKRADARRRWRAFVHTWSVRARRADPTGLGWVSQILSAHSLYDQAAESLMQSTPSMEPGAPWNEYRRSLEIAENAYLRDVDLAEVRHLATQALTLAVLRGDVLETSSAHLLIARTHANTIPPDFDAAKRSLDAGEEVLREAPDHSCHGNLSLWRARILLRESAYGEAANAAAAAQERFAAVGEFSAMSEALQVSGQALMLSDDPDAEHCLLRALDIARKGPYPVRQADSLLILGLLADRQGDQRSQIAYARESADIARRIKRPTVIEQANAVLGSALCECGDYAAAAAAFRQGLDAMIPDAATYEDILACGLAECCYLLGDSTGATQIINDHWAALQRRPRHRLRATAILWRTGRASEAEVLRLAREFMSQNPEPNVSTALTLIRLRVPGEDAAQVVARARQRIIESGQNDRLVAFDDEKART